jgi:hypothetical protein
MVGEVVGSYTKHKLLGTMIIYRERCHPTSTMRCDRVIFDEDDDSSWGYTIRCYPIYCNILGIIKIHYGSVWDIRS